MPTFFDKGACIFLQYGGGGCDPRARTRISPAHAHSSLARHPPARAKPGNPRLARESQNGDRATECVIPNHSCMQALQEATGETLFWRLRGERGVTSRSDGSLSFPKDPQKHRGTFFSSEDSGFSGDLLPFG